MGANQNHYICIYDESINREIESISREIESINQETGVRVKSGNLEQIIIFNHMSSRSNRSYRSSGPPYHIGEMGGNATTLDEWMKIVKI